MRTRSAPAFVTVWGVLVRSIATRLRVAALGLLGLGAVALGISVHVANPFDRADAAWSLVDTYGLSLLVPVVSLVFASAALGDVTEDGTLVYLWLRPYPRWQLAVAAFAASVTVVVPVAVLPLVLAAALTGEGGRLVAAAAAGGLLATIAYSAVFCGLGLRVRRALAWGLAYLLIWEQAVARVSHGAARGVTVHKYEITGRPRGPSCPAPQCGGLADRPDRPAGGGGGCPRAHLSVARPGGDRLTRGSARDVRPLRPDRPRLPLRRLLVFSPTFGGRCAPVVHLPP